MDRMNIEDLYNARQRIIQLEYDLAILKINLKLYFSVFLINAAAILILLLCLIFST